MSNKWNIPKELELIVKNRDIECVYCGIKFNKNPKEMASWEHINNKAKDVTDWNIVLCCRSCNSSKGVKILIDWFKSEYCLRKNINKNTVASIIKKYIQEGRN